MLTLWIILFLLFFLSIWFRAKQRKRLKRSIEEERKLDEERKSRERQIKQFYELYLRLDENAYKGKTKKEVLSIKKEIEFLMDKMEEEKRGRFSLETMKRIEDLLQKNERFEKIVSEKKKSWQDLQDDFEAEKAYASDFIADNSFYPGAFAYDTNDMDKWLQEIKEHKREDPLSDDVFYTNKKGVLKQKIDTFRSYHHKVDHIAKQVHLLQKKLEIHEKEEINQLLQIIMFDLRENNIESIDYNIAQIKERVLKKNHHTSHGNQ